jgi:Tfp pilus assembly protein PilO
MMRTAYAARIWVIGGVLGAILLLAGGWFLLVAPQHAKSESLRGDVETARVRQTALERELANLRKQDSERSKYEGQLDRDRRALPAHSGLSDFLRELQSTSVAANVSVSGLTIGAPSKVAAANKPVYSLPITVTADGTAANLDRFLYQLQHVQPRAVLVGTGTMAAEGDAKLPGPASLTLTMQVFVAQLGDAPAATPSGTTD